MSEVETGMEKREPEEFEKALIQALRRVDAPEGFAERVIGRMEESADSTMARAPELGLFERFRAGPGALGSGARVLTMRPRFAALRVQAWMGGAIAAMLVLGLFAGEQLHVRHEREQAEMATQQFETATRVTDHALQQVRAQLAQAGLTLQ